MSRDPEILWDVVEEHLSEADFLIERWQAAMGSPRLSVKDVQRSIEGRLNAHLDGLVVGGGAVAGRTLRPALADDSEATSTRAAAAALALLGGGLTPTALAEHLKVSASPAVVGGVATAFQISGRLDVDEPLRLALYATDDTQTQSAILSALVARQIDPGPIAGPLVARADGRLAPLALAALAAGDRARFRNLVEGCMSGEPNARAEAALRTALVWNLASGWRACPAAARTGSLTAMLALALFGTQADLAPLWTALQEPGRRGAALFALGFAGSREAVEACLPLVGDNDAEAARLAAEAIAAITGLPSFDPPFAETADAEGGDDELPPLGQDLRSDLNPGPHDDLPKPNPEAYRAWWTEHQGRLRSGERYLHGRPLSLEVLAWAMATRPLRRRSVLAFEIAVRSGGRQRIPAVHLSQPEVPLLGDLSLRRPPVWS